MSSLLIINSMNVDCVRPSMFGRDSGDFDGVFRRERLLELNNITIRLYHFAVYPLQKWGSAQDDDTI